MKNLLCAAIVLALAAAALLHRHFADDSGAGRGKPTSARPALLDDSGFLADLGRSGKRGLAGIRVVAPSSGLRGDSVERAHFFAEQLGIAFPRQALDPAAVPYNANHDAERLRLLREALADPEVEVLWALRGGYGAGRLLAALEPPATEKVFVGYSDATFLHLFFQRLGWKTVHGAMLWELGAENKDPANFRRLAELLAGKTPELLYDGIVPFNKAAEEAAFPIRGSLTGGNLTCLAAAAGTPWAVDARGRILIVEDVRENGYKIDRMFTQLKQSGALTDVSAVLLGTFTAGDEDTEYALKRFAEKAEFPVFRCDIFGHGERNYPLVFSTPAGLLKSDSSSANIQLQINANLSP